MSMTDITKTCFDLSLHGMQILRVVPYSATQLYSYEVLKKRFQNEKGEMSIPTRLACGGLAGMVATLVSPAQARHSVFLLLAS